MLFSSTECRAWFSVVIAESVAVGMVNLVTIVVFMKNRNLRRRSLYLVLNLAVADMLVGGLSTIHLFTLLGLFCDRPIDRSLWGKYTITFLFYFFPLSSIINIVVISLERLHATFRPFRHRFIKKWEYGVTIAVVWFIAAAVSATLVVIAYWKEEPKKAHHYVWQLFNLSCLFIICVSYAGIVKKMYFGRRPQHHGAASRERKLTLTLFIMTLVSLLMYLPLVIGSFLRLSTNTLNSLPKSTTKRMKFPLILLYYGNSLVNPLLYAIRIPEFKKALFSIFRRQQRQVEVFGLRPMY